MQIPIAARPRRAWLALMFVAVAGLIVTACGGTTATTPATPSTAPSSPSAAPATTGPTTAPASASPSAEPPTASPEDEACQITPQAGRLPSDRMTDVRISTSGTADLVTFVFGNLSLPEPPQGVSEGSLDAAVPPFTQSASGLPIDVTGQHVAQIRFSGMSIVNDVGEPTYDGTMDFRPDLTALKTVVNFDMFEGVVGWYIGYDGDGCVNLTSDATSVTVVIDHPS
jgi:hypothetical protein